MGKVNRFRRSTDEKKKRGGLNYHQEACLREILRREAPSEPWVDAQIIEEEEMDDDGWLVVRRRHDSSVFPPGKEQTAMIRCPLCRAYTPPYAMEGGQCLDHAERGKWRRSPSAVAIAQASR